MRALNYYRIDCIRGRVPLIFGAILVLFFSFIFSVFADVGFGFSCCYAFFVAIGYAGQPFNLEARSESGFLDMLPATKKQRVIGRFLYAITGVVFAIVVTCAVIGAMNISGKEVPDYAWPFILAITGVTLVIISIEVLVLYSVGKGKSQQLISLIQIVPSFVMFLGGQFVAEQLEEHAGFDIVWLAEHQMMAASILVAVGIVAIGVAFVFANQIVQGRDYA